MSNPIYSAELAEYREQIKRDAYKEAGLVEVGRNKDGEIEFIGTREQWLAADELYEDYLDNNEF